MTPEYEYYQRRFARFGHTAKAVGWTSAATQKARFDLFLSQIDFSEKRVLDLGCGLGDFYHVLKKNVPTATYIGIDRLPFFIEQAQTAYPEGTFITSDIHAFQLETPVDIIVASGVCNHLQADNYANVTAIVQQCRRLCSGTLLLSMLSSKCPVDQQYVDDFFYFDPEIVREICHENFGKSRIVDGILENDFSIISSR